MRRLLPLIASLMVILILWSGTAAHASETIAPASVAAAVHFDGDGDQAPADEHGSVPHHHGICHADHVGLPAGLAPPPTELSTDARPRAAISLYLPSAGPGAALRPPIA